MTSIQLNGRTYQPNGEERFGALGFTDGEVRIFARENKGRAEIFCGSKDWKPFFIPAEKVNEDQVVFYAIEPGSLDGFKFLD